MTIFYRYDKLVWKRTPEFGTQSNNPTERLKWQKNQKRKKRVSELMTTPMEELVNQLIKKWF